LLAAAATPTGEVIALSVSSRGTRYFRGLFAAASLKLVLALASAMREDARALLGGMSNGQFYEMKRKPQRTLDADTLTRVSYLIGIFKALNVLHAKKLADAWVRLPNSNRIFGGGTPLAYMIKGGLPAMAIVRRLLDARRGGM
jgi:hypothetical protein